VSPSANGQRPEYNVPPGTILPWQPKGLRHVLLTIDIDSTAALPGNRMKYKAELIKDTPDNGVIAYVKALAKNPTRRVPPLIGGQFDIGVDRPSYLVVELDHNWNWQFSMGKYGCTMKDSYPDDNFGLRHIYPDDISEDVISKDGCKILFFCVRHRLGGAANSFNFNVDVIDDPDDLINTKRLTIIYDPDIKNDGSDEWPTP